MKLPTALGNIFGQKQEKKEIFASLLLDAEYVAAALWEMGDKGMPRVVASASQSCAEDSWESRLEATDNALAAVEDKAGTTDYAKTVLGLPQGYLTETGEITKEVRVHIKEMTKELELVPIGFVSVHQALMYKLKKDEGIPPSVILLGISHASISLSLYKVGVLVGQKTVVHSGDIAIQLEEILRSFKELEVLPARILLYGHDGKDLTEVKSDLLKYPWTTRVNFLHFPKMEIITPEDVVSAVSLAGASELASTLKEESEPEAEKQPVAAPVPMPAVQEAEADQISDEDIVSAEAKAEEIEEEEEIEDEEAHQQLNEESNVTVVEPSHLGFRKDVDVLEETPPAVEAQEQPRRRLSLPKTFSLPRVNVEALVSKIRSGGALTIAGIAAVILLLIGYIYWAAPRATVTILESPKTISDSQEITISPSATVVDAESKIIPGFKQEESVSGDKTIAVTGKKTVGDPAKGSVTIYNKTLGSKSLPKGTVLTGGSLEFTLDVDVAIASASEDLGGRRYGKVDAAITASKIGTNGNMPASTTFAVKGYTSDEMTASNPSALVGGTSREVTVVTRADYDALVASALKDFVDQAKQGLTASVGGMTRLIEDTIDTDVTQKTFAQELDQEATQLSGRVTVTVSGVSYSEDDLKTLLTAFVAKDIPEGYTLSPGRTQVSLEKVTVKKDGTITATASMKGDAVPNIDLAAIQKNLAGKKLSDAESYLRGMPGIAGIEVSFRMSFGKNRLPMNPKNISVGLAIQ